MPGFHHILVPLDGTISSELAIAAAEQGAAEGGKLTLVQIAEDIVADHHLPDGMDKETFWESQTQPVRDYLHKSATLVKRTDLTVEVLVASGHPAEAILDVADELGVDAVSMSSHSRSKIRTFLVGSTTQTVIEKLSVPLILVHPKREGS